ncbi:hypothetical protein ACVWW2_006057 [Bradyrhizobium sp. LM4.3]
MAFPDSTVYRQSMSRLMCLSVAVVLSLLPAVAPAASIQKRPKQAWHGYGFLPGYRQPLSNSVPLYKQKEAMRRMSRSDRRHWYIDPVPQYYGWDGEWRYFGRPGSSAAAATMAAVLGRAGRGHRSAPCGIAGDR